LTQTSSVALIFFGATGDLAHKKIFPALQKLAKRGKLEMPVIGVGMVFAAASGTGKKTVLKPTAD